MFISSNEKASEQKVADKQWLRKLESFLKLPLHNCHWRKFKIRQVIIEVYISDPNKFDKAKEHLENYMKFIQVMYKL